MNEFSIINKYFSELAGSHGLMLKDDVATLPKDQNFAISTDTIIEEVHFLANSDPYKIALKLMGSSLSDLACKALVPEYYFLNLTLNDSVDEIWLEQFARGLSYIQNKYKIGLLGGDTTKHKGSLVISATVFGSYNKNIITRNNAKIDDHIWVTGNIGDSYLGLKILCGELDFNSEYLTNKYEEPTPRFEVRECLGSYANSAIDISDGLIQDLEHILESSDCGAFISYGDIPFSSAARELLETQPKWQEKLLNAGDDYEIIFTSNPENEADILSFSEKHNCKITKIGNIRAEKGLLIKDLSSDYLRIAEPGFNHFTE